MATVAERQNARDEVLQSLETGEKTHQDFLDMSRQHAIEAMELLNNGDIDGHVIVTDGVGMVHYKAKGGA